MFLAVAIQGNLCGIAFAGANGGVLKCIPDFVLGKNNSELVSGMHFSVLHFSSFGRGPQPDSCYRGCTAEYKRNY